MSWPNSRAAPKVLLYTSNSNCSYLRRTQLSYLFTSNSNCSCYGELNLFLFTSNSTVLFTSNSTFCLYVELKIFLYVELNSFWLRRTQFVLDTSSSTLQRVHSILQQGSSTPSASLLNSAARLLNSVSGSFHFCRLTS